MRDGERVAAKLGCRRAESRLSPWLDGELDAGEARALEEHLRVCSSCRRRGETLAAAREQFRRLPPERSRLQAADVLARVAAEEEAASWWGPSGRVREVGRWLTSRRRPPLAAALVLTVLILAVVATMGLWPRTSREPPERAAGAPAAGAAAVVLETVTPLPGLEVQALDCGAEGDDHEACRRFACLDAADCGADAEELWPPIHL